MRIPRRHCFASLANNLSMRFSQEARTGVNTKANRLGLVAKERRVSWEMWAEWWSSTT